MSATPRPWAMVNDDHDQHLPKFPLDGNMRHIGIVAADRPAPIATVWNAHHYTECLTNAELLLRAVNAFDALLAVAKAARLEVPANYPKLNRAMLALDAAHPDWRTWG